MADIMLIIAAITALIVAITSSFFVKSKPDFGYFSWTTSAIEPKFIHFINRVCQLITVISFLAYCLIATTGRHVILGILASLIVTFCWYLLISLVCWIIYGITQSIAKRDYLWNAFVKWFKGN